MGEMPFIFRNGPAAMSNEEYVENEICASDPPYRRLLLVSITGVWFIPTVSDKFGRKKGLALGAFVSVVGAIMQAVSMSLGTFVAARIILGAGCVITAGAGAPFITEIARPTERTTATAFFLISWAFGAIVAGWTTFGTFRA